MGVNYVQLIDGGVEFNYVHKDFLPLDLTKYPPPKDFKTNSGRLAFESSMLMMANETSSQQQIEWDLYDEFLRIPIEHLSFPSGLYINKK